LHLDAVSSSPKDAQVLTNVAGKLALEVSRKWRKPSLVVTALLPVLRGQPGRNPGNNDGTTRHLSGRSVRVLAFGLAFMPLASRMTTRERAAGKSPFQTHRTLASILGSFFRLCYFLCYFWGRNLGPFRQSEKTYEPIQPVHYQWFARVASDGVQRVKTGKSEFLSPVRLPFRHSGHR
jgi:hypothetical protein